MGRKPIISVFSYRSRRRRNNTIKRIAGLILLMLLSVTVYSYVSTQFQSAVPVFSNQGRSVTKTGNLVETLKKLGVITETTEILSQTIPLAVFTRGQEVPKEGLRNSVSRIFNEWVEFITRMEPGSIESILDSQLVALAEAANFEKEALILPPPPPKEDVPVSAPVSRVSPKGKVLIGIYTSHNAETYKPTDGVDRLPGKNGGVSKVAQVLASSLEEDYGIGTIYSPAIHDYPSWGDSYGNSMETAKEMLKEYPSIEVLIDVHRDAGIGAKKVISVQGERAAEVMFVVGTDQRWEHPNWKKNLEFANRLTTTMDQLYPGLSAGVRAQSGRYNQHLHPHAILIEMGSSFNSLEEAEESARLFAGILAKEIEKEVR